MQSVYPFAACTYIVAKQKSAHRTKPDLDGLNEAIIGRRTKDDTERVSENIALVYWYGM